MTGTGPWLTAAALPALPGLPSSERRRRDWLARQGVPQRKATGRTGGGGVEWDCSQLPAAMRQALMALQVQGAAEALPSTPAPAVTTTSVAVATSRAPATDAERACADARVVLVQHMRDLADGGLGIKQAAEVLAQRLASGTAPAEVLAQAPAANARARQAAATAVSARTLLRWHADHAARGWSALVPLSPQTKAAAALADDVSAVLARYASTAGASRNLSHCAEETNRQLGRPHDEWVKLYHRARRALPKLPKVDLIKARHTGAARDAKLPYKRRLTDNIAPHDVWVCDGHTFKAAVRHPDHGQPFAPEVTATIDVASRYLLGWSTSLSENTLAVGDAIRLACATARVAPAMLYSDNGGGQTGKMLDCPVAGIYSRLGSAHPKGLPGKPQGHGIIESSWKSHMLRAARAFGSYRGKDSDPGAVRDVRLGMARERTAVKRAEADGNVVRLSPKVPSWAEFVREVDQAVWRYNHEHRHRGLPKHTSGPHAGKHMTPAEALAAMSPEMDARLQLDDATIRALFMPAMLRTPTRGWVRLLNQWYHSEDLMEVDGQQCRVHYDIHDAHRVWVYTVDGRFVCECQHEGNSMDFMPLPAIEVARHRRVQAAIKRLDGKRELAQAELRPTVHAIDHAPSPELPATDLPMVERIEAGSRPAFFESAAERYEWLMQHRATWSSTDSTWLSAYAASTDYEALQGYYASRGIAWPSAADDAPGFEQAG